MSSAMHKEKIWNYIKDIKVGMLVTLDHEAPRARPMHLVQDKYDGTLWFFTERKDEKVHEIQDHHAVCITFSDTKNNIYVSLTGTARVTQDRALIEKFWNSFSAAYFPEGKDSPEVALLEVKVDMGEHWDATSSKIVQLYELARASLTHTKPDMGENEKFN